MRKIRKIIGNKKGIDTILAALLMVVIVVVASVMVYAWSTGLLGSLLIKPTNTQEAMNMEFSGLNNAYNVTMNLRNTGSVAITLSSYYVKDSAGNQYARTNWATGPYAQTTAINPNNLGTAKVVIGTAANQCGSGCTLTGSSFTFTTGFSYSVTVITSRNNQFTFTVTI